MSLSNTAQKKFSADLVTFTEEILNGKLHFLCSLEKIMSDTVDSARQSAHVNFNERTLKACPE